MKILNLKKLKLLYVNLIAVAFLFPSFGGVGGGLYAQDPRLFENTWYLHDLFIDGDSNIPPVNAEIPFVPAVFYENGDFFTGMCENSGQGELEYIGSTEFNVLEMNFLQGECYQNNPQNQDYSNLYQLFWTTLSGGPPVSYEIIEDGQIRTLIVTDLDDDFAIYGNEIPLSIDAFSISFFLIYPNPVYETLNLYNSSYQSVTAAIYDIKGKWLQSLSLENNASTIDVKALNPGVYFMVFESEAGEKVSKKFIKK